MNDAPLTILHLYSQDMNIYGDMGNVLVLQRRIERHGLTPRIVDYNPGDQWPGAVDIIVGGGGQDSGQEKIMADLLAIGPRLRDLAESGTPMLMICGLYQLFGRFFKTREGKTIEGIGLLDIETYGSDQRMIGNIITRSEEFGEIVGYENHSGKTYLGKAMKPFGTVVKGAGNNGEDNGEGTRYRHVIGTYLHGSLLPKNPQVADYLIREAALKRYGLFEPAAIDDALAEQARAVAKTRPR